MRLHDIELSAFGPFPETVRVDFDRLGADGLFLLHGDTGAGKTTVLDAVSFALYGRVPGARNEAKRLRCDRAAPGTRTFVRLSATLGGQRVEITRSPAYLRPKARGTGMTEEKPKVLLRWLDAEPGDAKGDGLTRAEEVGLAVRDLLGMSADQFFQVVLLPQGEFARFLRSDTAEREVVLERLFDTGRFGTIEEWFAAARRDSAVRVKDQRAWIAQLTARVAEAAGAEMCLLDRTFGWLADLRDRLADLADATCLAARQTADDQARAEQASTDAVLLAERVSRLRTLRSRQDELERAAGQRAAWRRGLAAWADAQPVVSAAGQVARLRERTAAAQAGVDHRRRLAEGLVAAAEDVPKTGRDLRAASAAARLQAGALDEMVGQAAEQQADRTSLQLARTAQHATMQQILAVEAELADLPAVVARLTERLEQARGADRQVHLLTSSAAAAETVRAAAEGVERLRRAQQQAATDCSAAVDAHQAAVDARQALVQRRILGMAGELAAALQDGHSCPVCGSGEHPAPAAHVLPVVTAEQIRRAERLEAQAAATRQLAADEAHAAGMAVAQAEAIAQGRSVEQARAACVDVTADLASASSAAREQPVFERKLQVAVSRAQDAAAHRQGLLATHRAAAAEADRLTAALAGRAERLERARAGFPDVAGRRRHLMDVADALERLAAASDKLEQAEIAEAEASTAVVEALSRSSFGQLAEAQAAAAIDRDDVAGRLRAAEDELTGITALLTDPALAGLDGAVEPDVAAAKAAAEAARSTADAAGLVAAVAAARRTQVAAATANLQVALRELEPVLAADAELAALTDVILGKGQNARSMSLRAFVLSAKLGQVALSAGERLAAMSGGRYTFVASEEKEARGRSGGLGLDVLDAFSGLVRPTKTLSGGESFLASLALALGLADVVAAEAGGRQLDTMFIDEGFGSLDADTLDMVMGTLDDLRAGGRIVGLVSHVEELRQRIPNRLHIRRTVSGSVLELATG